MNYLAKFTWYETSNEYVLFNSGNFTGFTFLLTESFYAFHQTFNSQTFVKHYSLEVSVRACVRVLSGWLRGRGDSLLTTRLLI